MENLSIQKLKEYFNEQPLVKFENADLYTSHSSSAAAESTLPLMDEASTVVTDRGAAEIPTTPTKSTTVNPQTPYSEIVKEFASPGTLQTYNKLTASAKKVVKSEEPGTDGFKSIVHEMMDELDQEKINNDNWERVNDTEWISIPEMKEVGKLMENWYCANGICPICEQSNEFYSFDSPNVGGADFICKNPEHEYGPKLWQMKVCHESSKYFDIDKKYTSTGSSLYQNLHNRRNPMLGYILIRINTSIDQQFTIVNAFSLVGDNYRYISFRDKIAMSIPFPYYKHNIITWESNLITNKLEMLNGIIIPYNNLVTLVRVPVYIGEPEESHVRQKRTKYSGGRIYNINYTNLTAGGEHESDDEEISRILDGVRDLTIFDVSKQRFRPISEPTVIEDAPLLQEQSQIEQRVIGLDDLVTPPPYQPSNEVPPAPVATTTTNNNLMIFHAPQINDASQIENDSSSDSEESNFSEEELTPKESLKEIEDDLNLAFKSLTLNKNNENIVKARREFYDSLVIDLQLFLNEKLKIEEKNNLLNILNITLENLEELKKFSEEKDELEEVNLKIEQISEIRSELNQVLGNKKRKTDSLGGSIFDIQYLKIN